MCHLPRVFLGFNYDLGVVVPPDVAHTKCLLLWGGNPEATNKPQEIARIYATTKPACISPRNALDQHTNTSVAIRAIDILMANTGNLPALLAFLGHVLLSRKERA